MGLFGKTRSREPAENRQSSSDEEDAPLPYPYGHDASNINDSKASLASSDGKNDHIDATLEELDTDALWLDALKADKQGSTIVRRDTQDILYTFIVEKRWTNPTLHMFHGSVPHDPEQRPATTLPFASMKYSTILLRDSPSQVEATKYKRRDIVKMPKWYGIPSLFTVGGTEYRVRMLMNSWSGKYILTVADDASKTPLCMFRPAKKLFGDLRWSIEILPIAISTSKTPKPHALVHDGVPTKLLDMALIAERVARQYTEQANSAAAGASSSASTSAAIASC